MRGRLGNVSAGIFVNLLYRSRSMLFSFNFFLSIVGRNLRKQACIVWYYVISLGSVKEVFGWGEGGLGRFDKTCASSNAVFISKQKLGRISGSGIFCVPAGRFKMVTI